MNTIFKRFKLIPHLILYLKPDIFHVAKIQQFSDMAKIYHPKYSDSTLLYENKRN